MSATQDILGGLFGIADQAVLQKVQMLKNQIQGGGPTEYNRNTEEYYLKVALASQALLAVEVAQAAKSDLETKKYYQKLEVRGEELLTAQAAKSDLETKKYYQKLEVRGEELLTASDLLDGSPIQIADNPQFTDPSTSEQPRINQVPEKIGDGTTAIELNIYEEQLKTKEERFNKFKADNEQQAISAFQVKSVNTDRYYDINNAANNEFFNEIPSQRFGEFDNETSIQITEGVDAKGNKKTFINEKGWLLPGGGIKHLGTPGKPYDEVQRNIQETIARETPGSFKFFIEKLHGRTISKGWNKKNPISPGKTISDFPNRMVFPAYIINYFDSYAMSTDSYTFLGRSEKVHIYQSTQRELTLEFFLLSDFSTDLILNGINITKEAKAALESYQRSMPDWGTGMSPDAVYSKNGGREGFVPSFYSGTPEMLWHRYTFLAQCMYPWYRNDGKMKEQPFIRLRIGDFYDVVGIITNVSSSSEQFELDLNSSARNKNAIIGEIPLALRITLRMVIVHEDEPSSTYFKFYNAKAYDRGEETFKQSFTESTKHFDSVLDGFASTLKQINFDQNGINTNTNDDLSGEDSFYKIAFDQSSINTNTNDDLSGITSGLDQLKEMNTATVALEQDKPSLNSLGKTAKLKNILKSAAALSGSAAIENIVKVASTASTAVPGLDLGTGIAQNAIDKSKSLAQAKQRSQAAEKNNEERVKYQNIFPQYGDASGV